MITKVINSRGANNYKGIYIGRPSKWGNPYTIGEDGNRDEVCDKYEEYVLKHPTLLSDLDELVGKTLGCWCKPKRCHGQFLLKLIQERFGGEFLDEFTLVSEDLQNDDY